MNIDVVEEHKNLEDRFISHFTTSGLTLGKESPLLIKDPTLLFTNSTIAPLKNAIKENNLAEPGLVLAQQCLRNQNFKNIYSSEKMIEYMSYFRMLAVLVSSNWHEELVKKIILYFVNCENIEADRIICKATHRLKFETNILNQIASHHIRMEYDSENLNYYQWQYGLDALEGIGLTFAIRTNNNTFEDIGNIIELTYQNKVIGYEFGFGVETFLARKHELPSPFNASKINTAFKTPDSNDFRKLQDAMVVSIILTSIGILPGRGKQNTIARKSISIISYYSQALEVTIQDIQKCIEKFIKLEFGEDKNNITETLIELIQSHSERQRMKIERLISFGQKNKDKLSMSELIKYGSIRHQLDPEIAHHVLLATNQYHNSCAEPHC